MSELVRDFTEDSKQKILSYVKNATANGWWEGLKDFFGDAWNIGRSWCGKLDVENYVDNIDEYHQEVVDMYDTTAEKIEEIFQAVAEVDQQFSNGNPGYLSKALEELNAIKSYIDALTSVVDPSKITQKDIDALNNAATALSAKQTEMEQQVQKEMQGTKKIEAEMSEDPVNLSSGNLSYEHQDLFINGAVSLAFHRFYNSTDKEVSVLGRGFVHNYQISVKTKDNKKFEVCFADGQRKHFEKNSKGVIVGLRSAMEKLQEIDNGYKLETLEGLTYLFDNNGKLVRLENRNSQGISFEYEEDLLIKALSDSNTFFEYRYISGMLVELVDNAGRKVKMSYDGDRLIKCECPGDKIYVYDYTDEGNIIEVTNPRGIIGLENKYDNKNRVVYQRFPDGSEEFFKYDDEKNEVIYTKRNGSKVVHVHDDKLRNIENKYEDGTSEKFIYNDKNQIIKKVFRNGAVERYAYDNRGNLTQYIDKCKCKTNYTYDSNNCLLAITVNGITKVQKEYDAKGNLISLANNCGQTLHVKNNKYGQPIEICYPDGTKDLFKYDAYGNTIEIIDRVSGKTTIEYDNLNRIVSETDAYGNKTTYQYNFNDKVTEVTNPLGLSRHFYYDNAGHLVQIEDYDGKIITQKYNNIGKVESYEDKENNTVSFEYDKMWNCTKVRFSNEKSVDYIYDSESRLEKTILPNGSTVTYKYDSVGNKTNLIDQIGRETVFEYDLENRLTKIISPDNITEEKIYDLQGNLIKTKDQLGNEITYEYDLLNRLVKKIDQLGNVYAYEYDLENNLTKVTYPDSTFDEYRYENGNLLQYVKLSDGTGEKYLYDLKGRLITRENFSGERISLEYDSMDRVIKTIDSLGNYKTYEYDAYGNVTKVVDELNNEIHYNYSPNGNLLDVVDALGNKTEYEYDSFGNIIKIIGIDSENSDKNRITSILYDSMGNAVEIINPLGNIEKYSYDSAGQIISKIDQGGFETKYSYSNVGKVDKIEYSDGKQVRLFYDAANRLESFSDWTGITTIETDAIGRVNKIINPEGNMLKYEYNNVGKKTSITYPNGDKVIYDYDNLGRLESLKYGDKVISYKYDAMSRIVEKNAPESHSMYTYNKVGLVEKVQHRSKDIEETIAFIYDAKGNKVSVSKERNGCVDKKLYKYDALNELTEVANIQGPIRQYKYDQFGNRIEKIDFEKSLKTNYLYDQANQLIQEKNGVNNTRYEYDKRGNTTRQFLDDSLVKEYAYDATNRMTKYKNNGLVTEYMYNGYGHRVKAKCENTIINYTVDLTKQYSNLMCMETLNEDMQSSKQFIWDWNIVAMRDEMGVNYYLQDDLGSTTDLLDENGSIRESYAYDEFGISEKKSVIQPFTYTGYQRDDSDLYYAQARRYNPNIGRFLTEDLYRGDDILPHTLNHYTYCWNSPLDYVDKNGLTPKTIEESAKEQIPTGYNVTKDLTSDIMVSPKMTDEAIGFIDKTVRTKYKIPTFTNKGSNVRITDSQYAKAPKSMPTVKESNISNWTTKPGERGELGRAYQANNALSKLGKYGEKLKNVQQKLAKHAKLIKGAFYVITAARDMEEEVQASASLPKKRQIANAIGEAGVNAGVAFAAGEIGGAIGTALFPGVGTIAGFVIGAAIGAVVDFAINVDWTGDGLSLMDTIKGGIYSLMCPAEG